MRPWIRWSSLALALCNTGCGEEKFEVTCLPVAAILVPINGSYVDLSSALRTTCSWKRVDGAGKAILDGLGEEIGGATLVATSADRNTPTLVVDEPMLRASGFDVLDDQGSVKVAWVGSTSQREFEFAWAVSDPTGTSTKTTTVQVPFSLREDASGGSFAVSPGVVSLTTPGTRLVTMAAAPATAAASVEWEVVPPIGPKMRVAANRSGSSDFIASFEPSESGQYVVSAYVDGIPSYSTTVRATRGANLAGRALVLGYKQSNTTRLYVTVPLSRSQVELVTLTRGSRVDTNANIPTEIASKASPNDFCGLAAVLNSPASAAAARDLATIPVSTWLASESTSLNFDRLDQGIVRLEVCSQVIEAGATPAAPPIVVDQGNPCSSVTWSNSTNGIALANNATRDDFGIEPGVFRVDTCVADASSLPASPTVGEIESRCADRRTSFVGLTSMGVACQ